MAERTLKRANQVRYRFEDPDLDFMFQWAAGAAKAGGLDAGELFWIAAGIDCELIGRYEAAFAEAVDALGLPLAYLEIPYRPAPARPVPASCCPSFRQVRARR